MLPNVSLPVTIHTSFVPVTTSDGQDNELLIGSSLPGSITKEPTCNETSPTASVTCMVHVSARYIPVKLYFTDLSYPTNKKKNIEKRKKTKY